MILGGMPAVLDEYLLRRGVTAGSGSEGGTLQGGLPGRGSDAEHVWFRQRGDVRRRSEKSTPAPWPSSLSDRSYCPIAIHISRPPCITGSGKPATAVPRSTTDRVWITGDTGRGQGRKNRDPAKHAPLSAALPSSGRSEDIHLLARRYGPGCPDRRQRDPNSAAAF